MVPAPRIPALEPPYDPEIARTLERMMGGLGLEPLLLFRVVAHNPTYSTSSVAAARTC
jgi:hypothetical protein